MNALFLAKVVVSVVVIVAAAEVAKRDTFWGAAIVALPLISILAMTWLYVDTRDNAVVTKFARDILFLVPVSLVFFLPFLLESRLRLGFIANLLIGLALLAVAVWGLRRFIP